MSIATIVEKWAEMGERSPPSASGSAIHAVVNHPNLAKMAANASATKNAPASGGSVEKRAAAAKRLSKRQKSSVSTRAMVNSAIKSQLKTPRDGVSYMAIKKYIAAHYQTERVDATGRLRLIKRYMRKALAKGYLVRSKPGKGLVGSFRFSLRKHKRAKPKFVSKSAPTVKVVATQKHKKPLKPQRTKFKAPARRPHKPSSAERYAVAVRKNQTKSMPKRLGTANKSTAIRKMARK